MSYIGQSSMQMIVLACIQSTRLPTSCSCGHIDRIFQFTCHIAMTWIHTSIQVLHLPVKSHFACWERPTKWYPSPHWSWWFKTPSTTHFQTAGFGVMSLFPPISGFTSLDFFWWGYVKDRVFVAVFMITQNNKHTTYDVTTTVNPIIPSW